MSAPTFAPSTRIAFIGGGNMASAVIGGLIQRGLPAAQIAVVEPFEAARTALREHHGIDALPTAGAALAGADLLVWAVKPQSFQAAAAPVAAHAGGALQLSVMAGIRSDAIAKATGSARIVRCMPNTPALVGRGMTGLFAGPAATAADRALAEAVEAVYGETGHALAHGDYVDALAHLARLRPQVDAFFDHVMVNVDDVALRQNRLALLKRLADRLGSVAAIEHLST